MEAFFSNEKDTVQAFFLVQSIGLSLEKIKVPCFLIYFVFRLNESAVEVINMQEGSPIVQLALFLTHLSHLSSRDVKETF